MTELETALEALKEGDLGHAAQHLAAAVADAANHPEVLAAIEAFGERAEGAALDHLELKDGAFHGAVALHAWFKRETDLDQALWLLVQAQSIDPAANYHAWIADWTKDASALDPERLTRALKLFFERIAPEDGTDPGGALLQLAKRGVAAHPEDDTLFFLTCVFTRRAGLIDDAVRMGQARVLTRPDAMVYVALAGALRESGDARGAVGAFREARALDPENDSVLLDIGDLHLELDEIDEAKAAYDEVLATEPEHPWAHPSALYCRVLLGEQALFPEISELANAGNERAHELLAAQSEAWVDVLPDRTDAIIQAAYQILSSDHEGAEVSSIGLSALEAPSAVRAFERALDQAGVVHESVTIEKVGEPDPRLPIDEKVEFVLWRYDQMRASAAVDAPSDEIMADLLEIALSGFDPDEWWERASEVDGDAEAIAAAMVHPPERPELSPWDLAFHVQVAAAFALAAHPDRRELLDHIVRGPIDWTTTAALGALAELARREPDEAERFFEACRAWLSLAPVPARYQHAIEPIALLLSARETVPEDLDGFLDAFYAEGE